MLQQYIFETIRDNILDLTYSGVTHVYPRRIKTPEVPTYAVIVNEISRVSDKNVSFVTFQFTCIAETVAQCYDLAMKLDVLFDNKVFTTVGDPLSSKVLENVEGSYDENRYTRFVSVRVVSHKEKLNYL